MPRQFKTLHDIGEEGAWAIMRPFVAASGEGGLRVGFGDDTAAIIAPRGQQFLATTDMLVEGVHFLPQSIFWRDLGRKAIAANLSDIAAMGGQAAQALVSIGLPPTFAADDLRELYRGMREELRKAGAVIAGGDTVRTACVVINITLLGFAPEKRRLPLRSDCRPGQRLYATGTLGDSAAGLALLQNAAFKKFLSAPWAKRLIARHQRPTPRLAAGQALAETFDDLAMIDLSDGLAHECHLLAESSRGALSVNAGRLPLSPALREFARATGEAAAEFALAGGEDYELLFATRADKKEIQALLRRKNIRLRVTEIGRVISSGKAEVVIEGAREQRLPGFEHF